MLEFVDGETLRQRLHHGRLPVIEAARIAAATGDVLAAAHQQGVLHRDIKPDNVMLARDGNVRVLDFGIARAMTDDQPLTRTGEILGTPEYMAPEQLLDGPEATDERTDVHALGILLYELLTDRSPFRGSNLFQALKLVESLVPPTPSSLRAEVPAALDAVVMQAMQKRREDRFATATSFAAAVRSAVPEPAPPSLPPQRRSWLPWLIVAALFAVPAGFLVRKFNDVLELMATKPHRSRLRPPADRAARGVRAVRRRRSAVRGDRRRDRGRGGHAAGARAPRQGSAAPAARRPGRHLVGPAVKLLDDGAS